MAKVVWTDRALAEVAAITDYIRAFNLPAAQRLARRIVTAGDSLADNPERGRPISGGRRELAQVAPYLIRYRVEAQRVLVLEVRHGAREPDMP